MSETATTKLTRKDFVSDQEVRWCPGCGDYAILASMQKYMADSGADPAKTVFVSGIGCSSRFPYYMNTFGFHTIHGRAPAIATGVKVANPELSVWMVTGDGDALSIGGNHLAHILRRNVDVNILLFNNEIYGLTKGQYSPTSPVGTVRKSTPMGSVDRPFNPISFALGCNATFVARSIDTDAKHLTKVFAAADAHRGTSFIEILQNCVIFNKDFYSKVVDRSVRADMTVDLNPGEKIIYGAEEDKGMRFCANGLEKCSAADADLWDPASATESQAYAISQLDQDPDTPKPIGIFRSVEAQVYEQQVHQQVEAAVTDKGPGKFEDLVYAGDRWTID